MCGMEVEEESKNVVFGWEPEDEEGEDKERDEDN